VKKLKWRQIRQKDPMNLNGVSADRVRGWGKRFNVREKKVNRLGIRKRKSKRRELGGLFSWGYGLRKNKGN